jgi:phage-related minor tail protein
MKDYPKQLNINKAKKENSKYHKDIQVAAQMQAANRLYEKQIDKVSKLIKKYQEAEKAYNPEAADEDKQKQAKKIDDLSIKIYKEQSLALIYANEAYYSAGPVLHVVGEMQMGLKNITTPMEYLQSLLVQVGYKLQHIQHYQHLFEDIQNERRKARKQDRVGLLFAKYGQRALDALAEITKTLEDAGVQLDLSHTSAKVMAADLKMEETKKTAPPTVPPQERVSQATIGGIGVCGELKDPNIKGGQSLNLKVMKSSWKELAIQMLARTPHLLNQLKS